MSRSVLLETNTIEQDTGHTPNAESLGYKYPARPQQFLQTPNIFIPSEQHVDLPNPKWLGQHPVHAGDAIHRGESVAPCPDPPATDVQSHPDAASVVPGK